MSGWITGQRHRRHAKTAVARWLSLAVTNGLAFTASDGTNDASLPFSGAIRL